MMSEPLDRFECGKCRSFFYVDATSGVDLQCTECGFFNNVFDIAKKPQQQQEQQQCKCDNLFKDNGTLVCHSCGTVKVSSVINEGADWNNYASDRAQGIDNSRVGWRDPSNPYSSTGSKIKGKFFIKIKKDGKDISVDLSKTCMMVNKNNKEKSVNEMLSLFRSLNYRNEFSMRVVNSSIMFWKCVYKTQNTYRGGVRNAIIVSCVFFSCRRYGIDVPRARIAKKLNISNITNNGEGIFIDIIINSDNANAMAALETARSSDMSESAFSRLCWNMSSDENPFNVSVIMKDIYAVCVDELSEISTPAAVGGIVIYYCRAMGIKQFTNKYISEHAGVTAPTLTKALNIVIASLEVHKSEPGIPPSILELMSLFPTPKRRQSKQTQANTINK